MLSSRDDCPTIVLEATDSSREWKLGSVGEGLALKGKQAELLAWLIGRSNGVGVESSTGAVPAAPRWL